MRPIQEAFESNDLTTFAIACATAVGVLLALALARFIVGRVLLAVSRRTTNRLDDVAARVVAETNLWLLSPLAIKAGASALELEPVIIRVIDVLAISGLVLQAGLWATRMTREWIDRRMSNRQGAEGDAVMALGLLGFAARVVIWAVVLLVLLDQMGFNITALVAGLGIGGVAIALAVQNVLGDLFASLSIVLDRPFVVGDFIIVDDLLGTVERVGVKTTRVRSLSGEMLVFSNSDLLKSRIRNYKQMQERRVVFAVRVTYQTPAEKVRAIPAIMRDAIEAQPRTRFDRAHFKEYGESGFVYEAVYYVLDPDYNTYMDTQQEINLAILDRFQAEGIEFAVPTRTVHVAAAGPASATTSRPPLARQRAEIRSP
ncbi:MAG TPA: mechanosensitive ion channel family protein [Usitatibacter sp.]|nr:mechanosensitive ion channel family protein [Usitatibacter sp.]